MTQSQNLKTIKPMKITSILAALLALFCVTVNAAQKTYPAEFFSVVGTQSLTNAGVTTASGIVPVGDGYPIIQFAQCITDVTNSGIRFSIATGTNTTVFTSTNVASTIIQAVGSQFAANDVVIVSYSPNDVTNQYERKIVSAVTATNITFTTATAYPTSVGDIVFRMQTNAWLTVQGQSTIGTNAVRFDAGGAPLFVGPANAPVLVDVVAATNAQLYNVSGRYDSTGLKP